MATINVKPRVFKNYLLKFGTDNYEAHVSAVTLTPAYSTQTWKGADGTTHTAVGTPTYTLTLEYAQDWETTNSLARFLWDNRGETLTGVEFSPLGAGDKFAVDIVVVPGAVGGAVDAIGTASTTLPVQGEPVYTAGV